MALKYVGSTEPLSAIEQAALNETLAKHNIAPMPDTEAMQEEIESKIRQRKWQEEKDRRIAEAMVAKIEAETEKFKAEIAKLDLESDLLRWKINAVRS